LLLGVASLALLSLTLPANAVERGARGSSDLRQQHSARAEARKPRPRKVRRKQVRRAAAPPAASPYVLGLYGFGGGYGGYARPVGDPLGLNPAVEFYRSRGRCVLDEGYGRYTFCDN
jgi:hypothetical protein